MRSALDLFCGAGGVTKGFQRAGYYVTGVDIRPQPNYYGDMFLLADALKVPLVGYDFIWASPPCQRYTQLRNLGKANASDVDLIAPVRARLEKSGTLYAIENVVGAPLRKPVTLCGSMFGLAVKRHRLIEANFPISPPPCTCRTRKNIAVYGKAPGHRLPDGVIRARTLAHGRDAMGVDWMSWGELTQAIPPAYAEFVAHSAKEAA